MAVALSTLEANVLQLLSKQNTYQGFYSDDQIKFAVNDSLDYVYANMMFNGEGWLTTIGTLDTVADTATVALPTDTVVIHQVRYLHGDVFVPLQYDDDFDRYQYSGDQETVYPTTYRLVGTDIYFNPIPSVVGTDHVQIEYSTFPVELDMDADLASAQITRGLQRFVTYRAASICLTTTDRANSPWKEYEIQWWQYLQDLLSKRIRAPQPIKDFRTIY
jgi:hypothetical protein